MGNLNSDMSGSDITATLNILSKHGVTNSDAHFLRQFPDTFARGVAETFKKGPRLHAQAIVGDEKSAVAAVAEINDIEMLKDIYVKSPQPAVWVAVMEQMPKGEIYHLVRIWNGAERHEARLIGSRKLAHNHLWSLVAGDGFYSPSQDTINIVNQVRKERGEESYKFVG